MSGLELVEQVIKGLEDLIKKLEAENISLSEQCHTAYMRGWKDRDTLCLGSCKEELPNDRT